MATSSTKNKNAASAVSETTQGASEEAQNNMKSALSFAASLSKSVEIGQPVVATPVERAVQAYTRQQRCNFMHSGLGKYERPEGGVVDRIKVLDINPETFEVMVYDAILSMDASAQKPTGQPPVKLPGGEDAMHECVDEAEAWKTWATVVDLVTDLGYMLVTDIGWKDTMKDPAPKWNEAKGEMVKSEGKDIWWPVKQRILHVAHQVQVGAYSLEPRMISVVQDEYRGELYESPRTRQAFWKYYRSLWIAAQSKTLTTKPRSFVIGRNPPEVYDVDKLEAAVAKVLAAAA